MTSDGSGMKSSASSKKSMHSTYSSKTCRVCSAPPDADFDAYAAGLLDGEGSITISKGNSDQYTRYTATVGIEMATKALPVLNRMFWTYGGTLRINRQKSGNQASTVAWRLHGPMAACFLKRLGTRINLKRQQAALIIGLYERDDEAYGTMRRWTAGRSAAWQAAREQVMALNARGQELPNPSEIARYVGDQWMTRSVDLFGERWETFSGRWPRAGSLRNGSVSERPTWVPPTAENAGSASPAGPWPTPTVHEAGTLNQSSGGGPPQNLAHTARQWTTPQAHDASAGNPKRVRRYGTKHGAANLADDVTLWQSTAPPTPFVPTPTAATSDGSAGSPETPALNAATGNGTATPTNWPTPHSNAGTGPGTNGRQGGLNLQTATDIWPTPATQNYRSGEASDETFEKNSRPLQERAVRWRTPSAGHSEKGGAQAPEKPLLGGHTLDLQDQASFWQTPASDSFRSRGGDRKEEMGLDQQSRSFPLDPPTTSNGHESSPSVPTSRRRLNPMFVEWLMNFPPTWTDPTPSAIAPTGSEPSAIVWWWRRLQSHFLSYGGVYITEVEA